MSWTPLSREALDSMIETALVEYDEDVRAAWARIRIEPEKWRCSPWGDQGGGFWVIAIEGDQVLWYNDIEDGFNRSAFSERGMIDEYSTSQTKLTAILDYLAYQHSERVWKGSLARDIPPDLTGAGNIGKRQTTYWELHAAAGPRYRIHFRDKTEVRFATADYPTVEIASRHPLLVQYDAPSRSLYFTGTPINPRALADKLDRIIRSSSEGWRSIADYGDSTEDALRSGHGLLMRAPEPTCVAVAATLEDAGVGTSILGRAPSRPGYRVLLLGHSYVIAQAFAFERR
jgi:hypothetical protein